MTDRDTHTDTRTESPESGKVYLVGAGPGDPDLLTVKARRLLETADVVLYDSLVGEDIVAIPGPDVDVVDVGKRPGDDGRRWSQAEINERIRAEARAGNAVVRLKGGDPDVFGRGGEEAQMLADHGIPFEVVPGLTSAVAAPELAGIPLTHREHASSLTVITGHEDPTKEDTAIDWDAVAGNVVAGGTLVILMGVGNLPVNVAALRERGVDAETPVAIVERATLGDGGVTTGTLDTIVERARDADVTSPAVIIVGDVVSVLDDVAGMIDSPVLDAAGTGGTDAAGAPGDAGLPAVGPDVSAATAGSAGLLAADADADLLDAGLDASTTPGSTPGTERRDRSHFQGVTIPANSESHAFEGVPGQVDDSG